MEPDGTVTLLMGTAGQGQGLRTTATQVVADRLGISPDSIHVVAGDTSRVPHGSGVWGSRSAVVTAGAADHAATLLRQRVVELAAHLMEASAEDVELEQGVFGIRGVPGEPSLTLRQLAETAHFRGFEFPDDADLSLSLVGVGLPPPQATFNNGAHAAVVEIDPELGLVSVLDYIVVEDCGVLLNPRIVDEQIRGGVVQGLGGALFEHLLYDERGQLLTTSMLDYHLPTADVVPDIRISHIETPSQLNKLGTKGAGEAGAAGAPAAIHGAVNDALSRAGADRVWRQPITPELVLAALAPLQDRPADAPGGRRA
jgi:carbon-monoxide dehydrogenase large subunit